MIMIMMMMMLMMLMAKVSIEPVERWERGILALKIIDELTMWFFTIGPHILDDHDYDDYFIKKSEHDEQLSMAMQIYLQKYLVTLSK